MKFKTEIDFFCEILSNLNINTSLLQPPYHNASLHDYGIRKLVYPNISYEKYIENFCNSRKDNILYRTFDEFLFNYYILNLSFNRPIYID